MDIYTIMRYEHGDLTYDETIAMFQSGIDSGLVWKLQGSYGRVAAALIRDGHCKGAPKPQLEEIV